MKKLFLFLLTVSFIFTSCDDYGKTVTINEKSEVYYKGDGVKEADAKSLGDFLLKQGYFTTTDTRAVQLLKDGEAYVVKFVVDEEKIKQQDTASVTMGFKVWQMWIQEGVFKGAKTKVILADAKLKSLQEVGEFTAQEKADMNAEAAGTGTSSQLATDGAATDPSVNFDAQTDSTNQ